MALPSLSCISFLKGERKGGEKERG